MKKYAVITNQETKECSVGLGTDEEYYKYKYSPKFIIF